jgi:hypothetical protein
VIIALLTDPTARRSLRVLEVPGIGKIEMAAVGPLATLPNSARGITASNSFNNNDTGGITQIGALNRLSTGEYLDEEREYLRFIDQNIADFAVNAAQPDRNFLHRFRGLIECTRVYVQQSHDGTLIAVQMVPALLYLATLERGWRRIAVAGAGTIADAAAQIEGYSNRLAEALERPVASMAAYLAAAGITGNVCASATALDPLRAPGFTPPSSVTPFVAIFTAWSFSAAGAYDLALRVVLDWLDTAADLQGSVPRWYRLRALADLSSIIAQNEPARAESPRARRILEQFLRELDAVTARRVSDFALEAKLRCLPDPGDAVIGGAERRLLRLRLAIADRVVNAVIDNEGLERELTQRDVEMARETRAANLDCLPRNLDEPTREILRGLYSVTLARVMWRWAATAEQSHDETPAELEGLRAIARREIRRGTRLLEDAYTQRHPTVLIAPSPCGNCTVTHEIYRDWQFGFELERARALRLEIAPDAAYSVQQRR